MILAIFGCALVSGIFEETSAMQWSALGLFIGVLFRILLCPVQYLFQNRHGQELSCADDHVLLHF